MAQLPCGGARATASLVFKGPTNPSEYSLVLRQRDVKASWTVTLNDSRIGELIQDERDMLRVLAVQPGLLRGGLNRLEITVMPGSVSDDIEIRDVHIEDTSPAELQRQSVVDIAVRGENGAVACANHSCGQDRFIYSGPRLPDRSARGCSDRYRLYRRRPNEHRSSSRRLPSLCVARVRVQRSIGPRSGCAGAAFLRPTENPARSNDERICQLRYTRAHTRAVRSWGCKCRRTSPYSRGRRS